MKTLLQLTILTAFLFSAVSTQAQLFDRLMGKDKEDKVEEKEQPKEAEGEEGDEKSKLNLFKKTHNDFVMGGKHFTYRSYTLNTDISRDEIDSCMNNGKSKALTDMQYYEQGEDLRFKDKNVSVTLRFLDDTERLTGIYVEDIEDIAYVNQLQQLVMKQMGEPTMGFEMMKNYDGASNNLWTDYSTYEYMFRYVIGDYVYDFQVTQYGAKMKKGKVVHPYNFEAVVSRKSEIALKVANQGMEDEAIYDENGKPKEAVENQKEVEYDEKKIKKSFYPPVGVQQFEDYTMEAKMLRKW